MANQKEDLAATVENESTQSGLAGGRGKETLFRVAARNQIELIAIADNKANIIVGINAVIISVIVALVGAGLTVEGLRLIDQVQITAPFGVLLIFSLVSCIMAIFAAKPIIVRSMRDGQPANSVVLFSTAGPMELEEYLEMMHQILGDRVQTYDQLIIEMYANGQVLKRKYGLLNTAYMLLMGGFVVCVAIALILQIVPAS